MTAGFELFCLGFESCPADIEYHKALGPNQKSEISSWSIYLELPVFVVAILPSTSYLPLWIFSPMIYRGHYKV